MMNKYRFLSALCAAAVTASAAGGITASAADSENVTLKGLVTEVDGSSVTLQLGGPGQKGGPANGQQPPAKPDGDTATDGQQPPAKPEGDTATDGQTPPAKPEGDTATDGQQPPAKPDGDTATDGQQPPAKPEGDTATDGQTPPAKPEGDTATDGQQPPAKPEGDMTQNGPQAPKGETKELDLSDASITENGETAGLSDIDVGDMLTVYEDEDGNVISVVIEPAPTGNGQPAGQPGQGAPSDAAGQPGNGSQPAPGGAPGAGGSGSSTVTQGSSANTITQDGTYTDQTYTSTGDDENALRVDGASVTLDGVTVDKSAGSSSNAENGDFYGVNAALLATNGANVTIKNATVTSSAQNGNGVFSYGQGTTVNISDSTITTTADNSGGIQTTGGGTTNASDLTVETSGNSSAAIRSDRGGGTVNVDGGSYTSNGYNSPAVYSTADITVKNADLTATNSEALVIEGKNSITLENCDVTGNMSDTKGSSSDENVHNVMIYQSMSGDADVGTSTFSMTGGSLTGENGDLIYVTNTHSVITLSGVTITNEDSDGALLRVTGNSASHGWGTAGSNGAQAEVTADAQALEGDIIVDSISTLNLKLTNGSAFTGTVNIVDNAQNGGAVDNNAVVTVDSGCTWTLTGDCTLTSLTNNGTINFNGYTITLADGTVLG